MYLYNTNIKLWQRINGIYLACLFSLFLFFFLKIMSPKQTVWIARILKINEKWKSGCQVDNYPQSINGPWRPGPLSFHRREREVTLLCEASLTRFPPSSRAAAPGPSPKNNIPTPYLEWIDQINMGPTRWAGPTSSHFNALIWVTSPHYHARRSLVAQVTL